MYRGTSNPDYHRPPIPPSGFGPPAASFGPPPFCPPFGVPPGPRYCAPPPGPPPGRPYGAGNENYNRESFYEVRVSRSGHKYPICIYLSQHWLHHLGNMIHLYIEFNIEYIVYNLSNIFGFNVRNAFSEQCMTVTCHASFKTIHLQWHSIV